VLCDIPKKDKMGDLRDRPRVLQHQPRKTPTGIEDRVVAAKNRTHWGPERLSRYFQEHEQIIGAGGHHPAYPEKEQSAA